MGTAGGYYRPPISEKHWSVVWGRDVTEAMKRGTEKQGAKLIQNKGLAQLPEWVSTANRVPLSPSKRQLHLPAMMERLQLWLQQNKQHN